MKSREKILAIAAFSLLAFLLVGLVLSKLVLAPAADANESIAKVRLDVQDKMDKVNREPHLLNRISRWKGQSYGNTSSQASANMRDHIKSLVARSGLSSSDMELSPVGDRQLKGAKQIGLNIRGEGKQDRLANLLYLLQQDAHINRIDNLEWTPIAQSTDVKLRFTLSTLVFDRIVGQPDVEIDHKTLENKTRLTSDSRKQYALINERDLFRPYIKRPPPPPKPPARVVTQNKPRTDNTRPVTPAKPKPIYRLVALSQWNAVPEIVVKELRSGRSQTLQIGEDFAGGEIIAVDYRPMALPKEPETISTSRVIVRIARDFWAIEIGRTISDKYLLKQDQLPPQVKAMIPEGSAKESNVINHAIKQSATVASESKGPETRKNQTVSELSNSTASTEAPAAKKSPLDDTDGGTQ